MRDQNVDGVLVGRPNQSIHESSAIQQYPIGMIYEHHGRRYRYCRAYEALGDRRGCPNMAHMPWVSENLFSCGDGDLKIATIVGDNKINVKVDDCTVLNTQTLDYFVDGVACIFRTGNIMDFRISGSDVSIADPDAATHELIDIYLDEPITEVIPVLTQVDLYPSPYQNVGHSNSGNDYSSRVVVPNCGVATAGHYFWGQTRGPCWVTPNAALTGAVEREVAFRINGTVEIRGATAYGQQMVGYILTKGDGSTDDSMIQLMLE